MKFRAKYQRKESSEYSIGDIYYDNEITKGLFSVVTDFYFRKNLKTLEIKLQIPDSNIEMGVRQSYQRDFVVTTIVLLDEFLNKHMIQFIMNKQITKESLMKCEHYILEGYKEVLENSIQYLEIDTLADLAKIKPLGK